jgi:alpha-galactosidase
MADIRTELAVAVRVTATNDAEGFPPERAWETAPPVRFCADWRGENEDRHRETEVRVMWSNDFLYLRFDARYRTITVFPDGEADGRRDGLWDRDVCEVFLQPPGSQGRSYKEIEVAPNGQWIDLDIVEGEKKDMRSGLRRRVSVDEANRLWRAMVALPMTSLVNNFVPAAIWRVNFYRIEGAAQRRFYSAWRATNTAEPNFHVPEAFGGLVFTEAGSKIRS